MREILFRAKRIDNEEWVEGQYAYILNPHTESGEPIKHLICNGTNVFNYKIDPKTLCQFTGLKDKSGKRIFEGDVIRVEGIEEDISVSWSDKFASWRLDKQGWIFGHFFGESVVPEQCEVIGNIHDNT